jgi:predicted metal-binding membrane protein
VTVAALLFVAAAAITIAWCRSMAAMPVMPMPGGWSMSMTWMRTPAQTWLAGAASFMGMWTVMMAAMMLPSLVPTLLRYREALAAAGERRLGRFAAIAGAGYFFVWTAAGAALYPTGVALAQATMRQAALSRAVPLASAVIVVMAIALQFSRWKAERLACCRDAPARVLPAVVHGAWRQGVRLGLDCLACCANLMTILVLSGMMDLAAMAIVTAAITIERSPKGSRVQRCVDNPG